jgi:PPP family 3-phenylpropionic acid transporter
MAPGVGHLQGGFSLRTRCACGILYAGTGFNVKAREAFKDKAVHCTRAFYLLYFGAIGCTYPFLNLHYQRIGLTGLQIGILSAISALVMPLTSPLWGILGDSCNLHRALLSVAVGGTIIPVLILCASSTMPWLVPATFVYAFFFGPIGPLVDSTALEVAKASQRSYGELRVWGTVGFIISAWVLGRVVERTNLKVLFYGYVLLTFGNLILSLCLPPRRQQWRGPAVRGLSIFLTDRVFLLFLASVFLLSVAVMAVDNFFALYLDAIGVAEGLMGLTWALAALSEVPVMFFSGALLRRLATRRLLAISFAVYALQWCLYSQVTSLIMILLLQLLHGFSYGAFVVAGVLYTDERAPEGLSATAQSLFTGITMGLAGATGGPIGGWFYDQVGVGNLFRLCSLAAVFALALFLLLPNQQGRQTRVSMGP